MKMIMLDLKRRVLGLVLCGLAAFARGGSVADGACRAVSAEEVRSALESLDVYVREGDTAFRLLSVAEAQAVVEDVFAKERPYRGKRIQARLKRLLSEGWAVMAYCEGPDFNDLRVGKYYLIHLVPDMTRPEVDADGCRRVAAPRQVLGVHNVEFVLEDPHVISGYIPSAKPVSEKVPFLGELRRFALVGEDQERPPVTRELIADVETVRLQSLTHLDASDQGEPVDFVRGNYLVTLHVRAALTGTNDFARFSFPVVYDSRDHLSVTRDWRWLYYRGITLSVGFAKDKNGEERIVRIDPVLPYPPYEKKGIRLCEESRELAEDSFAPVVAQEGAVKKSLFVKYGDHTLVRFGAAENLIEGPLGACPDFNATSFIRVWTDGAQANPDYWRNAWFSWDTAGFDRMGLRWPASRVDLAPALERMPAAATLPFSLRGLRYPAVSIRPPATMKDVADFFTAASRPLDAARRSFTFTADASCATRAARPYAAKDVDAFTAFREVCDRNGCAYEVSGTNVTIRAEFAEADCRPPDVAALHAELTSLGFASVKGATYVKGYFRPGVGVEKRDDMDEEAESLNKRIEDEHMPSCRADVGTDGVTWEKPSAADTNRMMVVALGCTWWEAPREECYEESVRLPREAAKLIFALEEGWAVDTYKALVFALQIHEIGLQTEARRIFEQLWDHPRTARQALQRLRETLARVGTDWTTEEAWRRAKGREIEEVWHREAWGHREPEPQAVDDDDEEEEDDDEE